MGRARGKGKKLTVTSNEEQGSGEEEKIPVQKRRGRPQKAIKEEEINDEEIGKLEEDDKNKDSTIETALENVNKRKRNSPTTEENGVGPTTLVLTKPSPSGFRHIGSRRKNKPRRAAEVGVEC